MEDVIRDLFRAFSFSEDLANSVNLGSRDKGGARGDKAHHICDALPSKRGGPLFEGSADIERCHWESPLMTQSGHFFRC